MCGQNTQPETVTPQAPEGMEVPEGYRVDRVDAFPLPESAGHQHFMVALTRRDLLGTPNEEHATIIGQYCPKADAFQAIGVSSPDTMNDAFDEAVDLSNILIAEFEKAREAEEQAVRSIDGTDPSLN